MTHEETHQKTLEFCGSPAPIATAPHLVVLRRHGELHHVLDSARAQGQVGRIFHGDFHG